MKPGVDFNIVLENGIHMVVFMDGNKRTATAIEVILWDNRKSDPLPAALCFAQPGIFDEE